MEFLNNILSRKYEKIKNNTVEMFKVEFVIIKYQICKVTSTKGHKNFKLA